jgi:hypothetical protein
MFGKKVPPNQFGGKLCLTIKVLCFKFLSKTLFLKINIRIKVLQLYPFVLCDQTYGADCLSYVTNYFRCPIIIKREYIITYPSLIFQQLCLRHDMMTI